MHYWGIVLMQIIHPWKGKKRKEMQRLTFFCEGVLFLPRATSRMNCTRCLKGGLSFVTTSWRLPFSANCVMKNMLPGSKLAPKNWMMCGCLNSLFVLLKCLKKELETFPIRKSLFFLTYLIKSISPINMRIWSLRIAWSFNFFNATGIPRHSLQVRKDRVNLKVTK